MNLEDVFTSLRPSIVAFGSKLVKAEGNKPPLFPSIIGTGFVVHADGVVATNRHVAEAMRDLPRHPETNEYPGFCLVFSAIRPEKEGFGLDAHFIDIHGFQMLTNFTASDQFHAEKTPDIALGQIRVRDLPAVNLATDEWSIRVGMEVATAGFPLGENPLVVHGVVGQGTPLLRRGIVSAVNPFPCPYPDGFTVDILSQGGASGSPIFRTDQAEVIGILYGAFPGVNITFCVPSAILSEGLEWFLAERFEKLERVPSIHELVSSESETTGFGEHEWDAV